MNLNFKKNKSLVQEKKLNELGIYISRDNYDLSIKKLKELCILNPFKTQIFIHLFVEAWSAKLNQMIKEKNLVVVGIRIRSLYMLVMNHKSFNLLVQNYFNNIDSEKVINLLEHINQTIHLAMQSQFFYMSSSFDESEKTAILLFKKIKKLLKSKLHSNDAWLLIRKALKNIKDKKKARLILEQFLQDVKK